MHGTIKASSMSFYQVDPVLQYWSLSLILVCCDKGIEIKPHHSATYIPKYKLYIYIYTHTHMHNDTVY